MKHVNAKAFAGFIAFLVVIAAVLFLSAWTFDYWQAWAFLVAFFGSALVITVYLMKKDPQLLERRISMGPLNEKEASQKVIQFVAQIAFLLMIVFPVLDHRFGWSAVPVWANIGGDVLIVFGFYVVFLVFKENAYASALIEVGTGQKVISTGPYAIVRHPMYSGAIVLMLGVPIALGSWWGLLFVPPFIAVIIWRLLDEEKFLRKNLPGYPEYQSKVTERLIPLFW